jgi:hypothetical protein
MFEGRHLNETIRQQNSLIDAMAVQGRQLDRTLTQQQSRVEALERESSNSDKWTRQLAIATWALVFAAFAAPVITVSLESDYHTEPQTTFTEQQYESCLALNTLAIDRARSDPAFVFPVADDPCHISRNIEEYRRGHTLPALPTSPEPAPSTLPGATPP